jgi:hypothetical protein
MPLPFSQVHRLIAVLTIGVGVLFVPRASFAQG